MVPNKKKILVIKARNELGMLDIACRLVQLDKEVFIVKNGSQALERIYTHNVDLIIAHDQMADREGTSFLRELTPELRRKVIYICFQADRTDLCKLDDLGLYEIMFREISPVRVAISAIEFFVFENENSGLQDNVLAGEALVSLKCQYDNPFN